MISSHQKQVKHGVDVVEVSLLPVEGRLLEVLGADPAPLRAVDVYEVPELRGVKGPLVLRVELAEEVEELVDPVDDVEAKSLPQELYALEFN